LEPLIAEHAAWAIQQIQARLPEGAAIFSAQSNELNPTNLTVASH
jgi:hypothetical protein